MFQGPSAEKDHAMEFTHDPAAVAAYEYATWSRCAERYIDGFGPLLCEPIESLLDVAAVGEGTHVGCAAPPKGRLALTGSRCGDD